MQDQNAQQPEPKLHYVSDRDLAMTRELITAMGRLLALQESSGIPLGVKRNVRVEYLPGIIRVSDPENPAVFVDQHIQQEVQTHSVAGWDFPYQMIEGGMFFDLGAACTLLGADLEVQLRQLEEAGWLAVEQDGKHWLYSENLLSWAMLLERDELSAEGQGWLYWFLEEAKQVVASSPALRQQALGVVLPKGRIERLPVVRVEFQGRVFEGTMFEGDLHYSLRGLAGLLGVDPDGLTRLSKAFQEDGGAEVVDCLGTPSIHGADLNRWLLSLPTDGDINPLELPLDSREWLKGVFAAAVAENSETFWAPGSAEELEA